MEAIVSTFAKAYTEAGHAQTAPPLPTTAFFYGLSNGEEIEVEIDRGKVTLKRHRASDTLSLHSSRSDA